LDQNDRAVAAALEYLRRASVDWSPHPTNDEVRQEYEQIWQQLGNRPIEALVDLPAMTDPACRATLDVLTAIEEPAYFIDENLRCLVVARIVNLSLERGNSDGSCVAYVQLGWFVGPRLGDYQAAFRFGKVGLDLRARLERFRTRVSQCFGYFLLLSHGTFGIVSNCCDTPSAQRRRPATSNMQSMPATGWLRFFSQSEIR
jgi:predicted ATPase